jgi:hypothetical protein
MKSPLAKNQNKEAGKSGPIRAAFEECYEIGCSAVGRFPGLPGNWENTGGALGNLALYAHLEFAYAITNLVGIRAPVTKDQAAPRGWFRIATG